jgi:hypothetical protein
MDSNTQWRSITNIQGFQVSGYKISESGIVLSNKRGGDYQLKRTIKDKVPSVQLSIGTHYSRHFAIHLLVATIFIPNPNNYKFIRFKDDDPLNYHRNNLEWTDDLYLNDNQGNWEDMKYFTRYEICHSGIRIKETKYPMKVSFDHDYPNVFLTDDNGENRTLYIHILMAIQFIPNPNNYPIVNHMDTDKTNFNPNNLEWTTRVGNTIHAMEMGVIPKTLGRSRCIEELDEYDDVINSFVSVKEAAEKIGCSATTIHDHFSKDKYGNGTAIINSRIIRHKVYEDLENEIWKPVNTIYHEMNLKYEASNKGRIRNEIGDIQFTTMHNGYYQTGLNATINNQYIQHTENVSRLVAFAFNTSANRDFEVDHIDKNPLNNNLENLQILPKHLHAEKDHGKDVLGVSISGRSEYIIFPSIAAAANAVGTTGSCISKSMRRTTNKKGYGTCKGYRWLELNSPEARLVLSSPNYVNVTSANNFQPVNYQNFQPVNYQNFQPVNANTQIFTV